MLYKAAFSVGFCIFSPGLSLRTWFKIQSAEQISGSGKDFSRKAVKFSSAGPSTGFLRRNKGQMIIAGIEIEI